VNPFGRRSAQGNGLSAAERWAQAVREGQARLDGFSQAELDCVTLDPEFAAASARGRALQAVGPILSVLAARRTDAAPSRAGLDLAPLSRAAADLDRRGYLRPGRPSDQDTPVPLELAGWSADPAGSAELRPVTILGDLCIITRARAQPSWVAEVSEPRDRGRSDPSTSPWQLVARMYATQQPSAGVVEFPPGEDGGLSPFSLLWAERAVWALWSWSGIDLDEMRHESNPAFVESVPDVSTAELAGQFTAVRRLQIAHPAGERVLVRTLITAAAERRHWILDGEHAERAIRVSVNQLGERIQSLIQPPGQD
jgi:hypothetical protein